MTTKERRFSRDLLELKGLPDEFRNRGDTQVLGKMIFPSKSLQDFASIG